MATDEELIAAFLAGDLDEAGRDALLARCQADAAVRDELLGAWETDLLIHAAHADTTEPDALREQLMEAVREADRSSRLRARTMQQVRESARRSKQAGLRWQLVAAAVIVVVGGIVGPILFLPGEDPEPKLAQLIWRVKGPMKRGYLSDANRPAGAPRHGLITLGPVVLTDGKGAVLHVATGSHLAVPARGDAEPLTLIEGALAAEVSTRDTDQSPLVIQTAAARCTVLGTRFTLNVKTTRSDPMKPRTLTTAVLLAGVLQLSNPHGALVMQPGDVAVADDTSAPTKSVEGLAARFGKHYVPVKVTAKPAIKGYTLPLKKTRIGNYDWVMSKIKRSAAFEKQLKTHGIAAGPWSGDDFTAAYKLLKEAELPVFVTSDSILHLYHMQFDDVLKAVEQKEFVPQLTQMTKAVIGHLQAERKTATDADAKLAIDKAIGFLALGHELLTDQALAKKELVAFRDYLAANPRRNNWEATRKLDRNLPLAYLVYQSPDWRSNDPSLNPRKAKWNQRTAVLKGLVDRMVERHPRSGRIELSDNVRAWVDKDRAMVDAHKGFGESAIFTYLEDFSQYVPRGHYTKTYDLRRYFNAMMWYGRLTFLVKGGEPYGPRHDYLVSSDEARLQTTAAAYMVDALRRVTLDGQSARVIWERIYGVTSFFVGLSDDLGYTEYHHALTQALGKEYAAGHVADAGRFMKVKTQIARLSKPAIYSGTGNVTYTDAKALAGNPSPEILDKALGKTQGFRFMGQRFVPDAYFQGKLVQPTVGIYTGTVPRDQVFTGGSLRLFPRGLDVMALLGSARAKANLKAGGDDAYKGYAETFDKLKKEIDKIGDPDGWNVNLYWSWLYSLKSLLVSYPEGYQPYMRTNAWEDKQLVASLGSWAQLRHDTILYVKQPYGLKGKGRPPKPKDFPGYVEAVPELYARLVALTRLTAKVLGEMNVLDDASKKRLAETEKLIDRLRAIAETEVAGKPITADDAKWIKGFSKALTRAVVGLGKDAMKTTLVADVFTDTNTSHVLEEATGKLGLIVVANQLPDGSIGLAVGPVFTYYEFKHPMSDRLTDEKWRVMLRSDQSKKMPRFTRSYFVK